MASTWSIQSLPRRTSAEFTRGPACAQAPKITRVPVDGMTSFFGISLWTAMIVFTPKQCMGMM